MIAQRVGHPRAAGRRGLAGRNVLAPKMPSMSAILQPCIPMRLAMPGGSVRLGRFVPPPDANSKIRNEESSYAWVREDRSSKQK
jgi:hypothetical protein